MMVDDVLLKLNYFSYHGFDTHWFRGYFEFDKLILHWAE